MIAIQKHWSPLRASRRPRSTLASSPFQSQIETHVLGVSLGVTTPTRRPGIDFARSRRHFSQAKTAGSEVNDECSAASHTVGCPGRRRGPDLRPTGLCTIRRQRIDPGHGPGRVEGRVARGHRDRDQPRDRGGHHPSDHGGWRVRPVAARAGYLPRLGHPDGLRDRRARRRRRRCAGRRRAEPDAAGRRCDAGGRGHRRDLRNWRPRMPGWARRFATRSTRRCRS